jgi:hypothetical protein
MRQTSALYELLQAKLGRDLRAHVVAARLEGVDWRTIAGDLKAQTDVTVSWETLRVWFTQAEADERRAAARRLTEEAKAAGAESAGAPR